MTEEQLKESLSAIGTIAVFKNDYVFTLMLLCEDAASVMLHIMDMVKQVITDKPIVEVVRNEGDYILIILKPENQDL